MLYCRAPMRATGRSHLALVAILLVTFLAFVPSLGHDFTLDDALVARGLRDDGTANPYIATLRPLGDYFASAYWAGSGRGDTLYRPVTILTHALCHAVAGDAAWFGRLVNVLLHLLATALVWGLVGRLGYGTRTRVVASLLFGLHAIHTEAVVGLVGRAELLAFAAGLGAALVHTGQTPNSRLGRGVTTAALLFVACTSKETGVVWALLLFVLAAACKLQQSVAPNWPRLAGQAVAVAALPLLAFFALRAAMIAGLQDPAPVAWVANPLAYEPAAARIASATLGLAHGLRLCLWPFGLSCDWGAVVLPILSSLTEWRCLLAASAFGIATLAAIRGARRAPWALVATAVFFGFALPISNIPFAVGTNFAERLYYTPSLALALAAAVLARGRLATLAMAAWLVASAGQLVLRQAAWRDNDTLVLHDARQQPRSVHLRANAGAILALRGLRDAAVLEFEAALALDPEHAFSWSNLAAVQLERRQLDHAERAARRGLTARHQIESEDQVALRSVLAAVLRARGDLDGAAQELGQALVSQPAALRSWQQLEQLQREGNRPLAWLAAHLDLAAATRPGDPHWDLYRGILHYRAQRYAEAMALFAKATELPDRQDSRAPRTEAQLRLAECAIHRGEIPRARTLLETVSADVQALPAQRERAQASLRRLGR